MPSTTRPLLPRLLASTALGTITVLAGAALDVNPLLLALTAIFTAGSTYLLTTSFAETIGRIEQEARHRWEQAHSEHQRITQAVTRLEEYQKGLIERQDRHEENVDRSVGRLHEEVRRLRPRVKPSGERAVLPPTYSILRREGRSGEQAAEDSKLALFDLGHEISTALRRELDRGLLNGGRPFLSGGPLGAACLPLAGAGAGIATSLAAGNVFVASANPATLMSLGSGVGSAIIGPAGKIVGHAAFLPAAGALMPVVAPVLLFSTFSSMMMSVRFDRIEQTLAGVTAALKQLLSREIFEGFARLLSATDRLKDIHDEYGKGPGFTDEMKIRLALVERDVNVLRHKHHALARERIEGVSDARLSKGVDRSLFVAASIADVWLDELRLLLALQDNPADATRSRSTLERKAEAYRTDLFSLLDECPIEELKNRLRESASKMSWWQKNLTKRRARQQSGQDIDELDRLTSLATWDDDVGELAAAADPAKDYSILFWRDCGGAGDINAWYTSDYKPKELAPT